MLPFSFSRENRLRGFLDVEVLRETTGLRSKLSVRSFLVKTSRVKLREESASSARTVDAGQRHDGSRVNGRTVFSMTLSKVNSANNTKDETCEHQCLRSNCITTEEGPLQE